MPVKYVTQDASLTIPDDSKQPLHEYYDDIQSRVNVDVIGVTGQDSAIRRIVLSDKTDVSDLEEWLNSPLSIE